MPLKDSHRKKVSPPLPWNPPLSFPAPWQEAIDKLSKVVEIEEDYQNGNAVYYLAQSYRRTEELEKAFAYYQIVVNTHPGTIVHFYTDNSVSFYHLPFCHYLFLKKRHKIPKYFMSFVKIFFN